MTNDDYEDGQEERNAVMFMVVRKDSLFQSCPNVHKVLWALLLWRLSK